HLPPPDEIAARIDEHAFRRQTVAAGAPRLLLVMLGRTRRARMHDIADVRSIDPHPERHRGDDDVRPLVEKRLLMPAADLVGQTGVVRHGGMAVLLQPCGERLDLLAGSAIHDPRLAFMAREYLKELTAQFAAPQDAVGEIRPIE